jgi:hypothetical protein
MHRYGCAMINGIGSTIGCPPGEGHVGGTATDNRPYRYWAGIP